MNGPTQMIVRAALATKVEHVKQAVESYANDRLDQGKSLVKGYAIGAGLYAAAGMFLIAALFVGAVALFRWIELNYGSTIAFGSIGGGLVLLALICALIAAAAMRAPKANFVPLSSRLRVAMRVGPKSKTDTAESAKIYSPSNGRDYVAAARDTATSILRGSMQSGSQQSSTTATRAGAAVALSLVGWALARRYSRPARPVRVPRPQA